MTQIRCLLFVALLLPLSACLEVDTRVLVKADGSGTLTERIVLKGPIAAMMQQMVPDGSSVIDQQQVEKHAKELGRGVKMFSITPLAKDEGVGAVAVFAFEDINQLRVDPNPTAAQDTQAAPAFARSSMPVAFHFVPGAPAVLTVRVGDMKSAKRPPRDKANGDTTQLPPAMLLEMFAGMRIAMAISVGGQIIETNATYLDGNSVTLMELDFDTILAHPAGLKAMQSQSEAGSAGMKAALKTIPGVKIEPEAEVRIVFTTQAMASPDLPGGRGLARIAHRVHDPSLAP